MNLLLTDNKPRIEPSVFANFKDLRVLNLDPISAKENLEGYLINLINQIEKEEIINNIILPINIHGFYSDFIGLQIGYYIRTAITESINRSNLIFYGPESISEASKFSDYSGILSTQGVILIPLDRAFFSKLKPIRRIIEEEKYLLKILKKIQPPKPNDMYGNHGIANVWGLYQFAKLSGFINNQSINAISEYKNKSSNIYFRWLKSLDGLSKLPNHSSEIINTNKITLEGIKIVGEIEIK